MCSTQRLGVPDPCAKQNWLLAKLSRTTLSGDFVPQIDGLRFLAIMAVIAFHVGHYVSERSPRPYGATLDRDPLYLLSTTGHVGVQMFFVISGMVVSLPFAKQWLAGGKKVSLKYYFLRRLTRIEPPYVIALVFWMLAFGISGKGVAPWPVMLRHFPASLFYVHNAVYGTVSYVLPPAWSLEIEVQFYVIAPLLALVFVIRGASLRRMVILLAVFALAFAQSWLRLAQYDQRPESPPGRPLFPDWIAPRRPFRIAIARQRIVAPDEVGCPDDGRFRRACR